jgi:signal recognition particle GTPase
MLQTDEQAEEEQAEEEQAEEVQAEEEQPREEQPREEQPREEQPRERLDRRAANAQRQKAYRERMKQAAAAHMAAKGLPSLPVIPGIPGQRRWTLALIQAQSLTRMVAAEMQSYYNDRSAEWQEDERGEEFQERVEAVEELVEALDDLLAEKNVTLAPTSAIQQSAMQSSEQADGANVSASGSVIINWRPK